MSNSHPVKFNVIEWPHKRDQLTVEKEFYRWSQEDSENEQNSSGVLHSSVYYITRFKLW